MPQHSVRPSSGASRTAPPVSVHILSGIVNGLPLIACWRASWRWPQTAGCSREVSRLIFV